MSVNQDLHDALIRHAVRLEDYKNSTVRDVLRVIDEKEQQIVQRLRAEDITELQQIRLEAQLAGLRSLAAQVSAEIESALNAELQEFATVESSVYPSSIDEAVNQQSSLLTIAVYSALGTAIFQRAMATPYQGEPLTAWVAGLGESLGNRIVRAVRDGITQSFGIRQIIANARQAFIVARRDADALVRSALGHISAEARNQSFEANPHIVRYLQWNSILDGRTTIQWCVPRDNKLYTLDKKPVNHNFPWGAGPGRIHWRCRSSSVVVTKPADQLTLDVESPLPNTRPFVAFRAPEGVTLPKPASRLPMNQYLEVLRDDGFSRSELSALKRRFLGRVPRDTDYGSFLKRQPKSFVEEVLGVKRAELFLDGKLQLNKFYNDAGRILKLDELKAKYPRVWSRTFSDAA